MILEQLHLFPFAGVAERTVAFKPQLNVVLGPNEAGKSTLMAALRLLLFTPSKCGKRRFGKEVAPFMPLGGGDTIRAELAFSAGQGGAGHLLSVAWGEGARSELRLPDGNLLAGDEAVRQRLNELLVLREGTWRTMLFAGQAGVARALDSLGSGDDPVTDLAAVLRRALFETDGISIEQLEHSIEERYSGFYRRWDRELNRPENNRGIDHPYRREVGGILAAFYERERARRTRDLALEYERELDRVNGQLNELARQTRDLGDFLEENRQAAEDARLRRVVALEQKALEKEEAVLKQVNASWPAVAQELKGLAGQRDVLNRSYEALTSELEQATALDALRRDMEKLERAEKEHRSWREALEGVAGLPEAGKTAVDELVSLDREIQQLAAGLRAGRITLSLQARKPMDLTSSSDFEASAEHQLAAGEQLDLQAGGQISLEHPQWSLKVNSGDTDAGALGETRQRLSLRLADRLEDLGFPTVEQAVAARSTLVDAERRAEACRQRLDTVLDGETLEELRGRKPADLVQGGRRPVAEIARDEGRTSARLTELKGEIRDTEARLNAWQEEYGTPERLLDLLLEKREGHRAARDRLDALTPLPDGAGEADSFVTRYEGRQAEYQLRSEALTQLKMTHLELQARGPGETLEEASAVLRTAEAGEQRVLREAAAVDLIRAAFAKVRAALDAETMDPWIREVERLVPCLTGGRYRGVDSGVDGGARLASGTAVPTSRLSMGTRAGVGLAVRLSMARYFLGVADGFLILDDPLVDMDPDRQAEAAKVITEFAADRQTILLTCHPAHAKLLGGHLVELDIAGGKG